MDWALARGHEQQCAQHTHHGRWPLATRTRMHATFKTQRQCGQATYASQLRGLNFKSDRWQSTPNDSSPDPGKHRDCGTSANGNLNLKL